jgi:hypothetical protein
MNIDQQPVIHPESNTQPHKDIDVSFAIDFYGSLAYWMLKRMYDEPFTPYLPAHVEGERAQADQWEIIILCVFVGMGLIATASTGDGFTLTRDGRYWLTQYFQAERIKNALARAIPF